jgi:hypothetical protein
MGSPKRCPKYLGKLEKMGKTSSNYPGNTKNNIFVGDKITELTHESGIED